MIGTKPTLSPISFSKYDLPKGWASAPIRDVLYVKYGKGLPEKNRKTGPYPVYGSNGVVGYHHEPLTSGSTIIVGRKGTVGALHYSHQPCWPIDTTYFIEEVPGLDMRFLYYALSTLGLSLMDTSSAIPGLNREDVLAQVLPLPPFSEQKRIVAKLEMLLERVNSVRARLANVPAIIKRFRQSVLAAACSGKLTETWRISHKVSESASMLINRIAVSRPTQARVLAPDVPHVEDLPDSWARVTIGFLAEPTLNGRPYVTSGSRGWARHISDKGPYFIRSENINTDVLQIEKAVRVDAPAGAEADRTRIIGTDLLLTITGNNVGRTAVVPINFPKAHVSQHVAIIRTTRLSNVYYLWLWLRSKNHGQGQLEKHFYGETKPGLNLDQVKSLWVDLPPLEEQEEIVRRVEVLFALADGIEAHVQETKVRAEQLTQAILSRTFRGELVPTEAELAAEGVCEYEPAERLLSRISDEVVRRKAERKTKSNASGKREAMKKIDKTSVLEAIKDMPQESFAFDDLRTKLPGDYDALKEILFTLLDDSDSGIVQVFDKKAKAMRFHRKLIP